MFCEPQWLRALIVFGMAVSHSLHGRCRDTMGRILNIRAWELYIHYLLRDALVAQL